MASTHVLRVPWPKRKGGYILVQAESAGSKALDLRLVATEGENPYTLKLRHKSISALKAEHSPCSNDEWERVLQALFLEQNLLENIEVSAEVTKGSTITLAIKKAIQGITQRLGALELSYDDKLNIELFDWCGTALESRDKLKEDLATNKGASQTLEKAVADLKSQLDELIAAKQSDETELIEKFQKLLNEKKNKIREQQRMLATVDADGDGVQNDDSDTIERRPKRAAKASRSAKRKAAQAAVEDEAGSESDDGFDKMDIDSSKPAPRTDEASEDHDTTDQDETASEPDDDEDDAAPAKPPPGAKRKKQDKAPSPPPATTHNLRMPPRREIPFASSNSKAPATGGAAAKDDDETDSDDEL